MNNSLNRQKKGSPVKSLEEINSLLIQWKMVWKCINDGYYYEDDNWSIVYEKMEGHVKPFSN